MLEKLDQLIIAPSERDRLLPHAASVVPKLLASLRHDGHSSSALAQQVERDVALATDVMRLANSAHYQRNCQALSLTSAIQVIGDNGLRSVIARAVIRPMFASQSGDLAMRSAAHLWGHVENKAQRCASLATDKGMDSFKAYLAGLVHDVAWAATFRGLDKVRDSDAPWCFDAAFIDALLQRRDRLFGLLATRWQLEPVLIEAANEISQHGLRHAKLPLARILRNADEMSSLLALKLFRKDPYSQAN